MLNNIYLLYLWSYMFIRNYSIVALSMKFPLIYLRIFTLLHEHVPSVFIIYAQSVQFYFKHIILNVRQK